MRGLAVLLAVVAMAGFASGSVRRRKNPPGANLDHDELHDDLQFAGRDVPGRLLRTVGAAGRFDGVDLHTAQTPGPNVTASTTCVMNCTTTQICVPDDLRPNIAVAVIGAQASTQLGNRFRNEVERLFGGGLTDRDGFRGAMEIEKADMADARRDVDVGRIAGEPHAGEAILHDVERLDHDRREARPRACRQ